MWAEYTLLLWLVAVGMSVGWIYPGQSAVRTVYNHYTTKQNNKVLLKYEALTDVAQWIEHRPVNQKVTGSIPSQGTCLGCGAGPQFGAHEIDVSLTYQCSLPLFLPPFPSL